MGDDLTPSGGSVVQTGISGLGDFFRGLGDLAIVGISRKIDAEIPVATVTPGTASTAPIAQTGVEPPGIADVFANLTPLQLGGLGLAGVGIWALVTGKFR